MVVGDCWPGLSSYIDFLNPNATAYYSSLYAYDKFNYTTPTIGGIWNDMNEPSVFDDDAEKTLPKTAVHDGGVEHRDIHNFYGFLQVEKLARSADHKLQFYFLDKRNVSRFDRQR